MRPSSLAHGEAVLDRALSCLAVKAGAVLAFVALTAVAARVRIPLPWTPVPITLQVLPVFLSGALLGPKLGAISMGAYLLAGLLGLPVFAGGRGGLEVLLGPSAGYLLGFVAGAAMVPWVRRLGRPFIRERPLGTLLGCVAGVVVIYAFGCSWLWGWYIWQGEEVGLSRVLLEGAGPFVGVDILKSLAVVALDGAAVWVVGRKTASELR